MCAICFHRDPTLGKCHSEWRKFPTSSMPAFSITLLSILQSLASLSVGVLSEFFHKPSHLNQVRLTPISLCHLGLVKTQAHPWSHESLLKKVTESISTAIDQSLQPSRCKILFIRVGEHPPFRLKAQTCLLGTGNDWQLRVDLGKQLRFPENIAETSLIPDNVLLF